MIAIVRHCTFIFSGTVYSDDRNHFWKLHHFHIYSISTFNIQVSKAKFFQVSIFFHEPISIPGFLWPGASMGFSNNINYEASRSPPSPKKPSGSPQEALRKSPGRKGRKSVHKKNYPHEKKLALE